MLTREQQPEPQYLLVRVLRNILKAIKKNDTYKEPVIAGKELHRNTGATHRTQIVCAPAALQVNANCTENEFRERHKSVQGAEKT